MGLECVIKSGIRTCSGRAKYSGLHYIQGKVGAISRDIGAAWIRLASQPHISFLTLCWDLVSPIRLLKSRQLVSG